VTAARREVLLVDLGLGNLRSVARALERAGAVVSVSGRADDVRRAERLVVPGQGAFRDCAVAIAGEFGESLLERIATGVPYLGICLGMQMLFESSEEAPGARGLGLFDGEVVRLRPQGVDAVSGAPLKIPHMGWNEVRGSHPLLPARDYFYFVHSYQARPSDSQLVVATAEHGETICAAVARDNVFACQFHPEKSSDAGARVLERFLASAWS